MIGAIPSMTVLTSLAALHFYWALGGRAGKSAAIPERNGKPVLRPTASATLLVGLALLLAVAIIATQARFIFPGRFQPYARIVCAALALVFLARAVGDFRYVGFFKSVGATRFARLDTYVFSPLCLVLSASIADVALRAR